MEIREKFLKFFERRGHTIVKSSSLVPDEPSVLLTTAGVQQFKPYFVGLKDPLKDFSSQRATSCQKSFRTSDIDQIGDETHLTFFEMLGNFSFGPVGSDKPDDFGKSGYFKRSAIHWAWQFLNETCSLKERDFFVTVFQGDENVPFDEESYNIWRKEIGIPEEKIKKFPKEDNFWGPTGLEGPCGPTTEIHIEGVEVWNLVFNQYFQEESGKLKLLKNPGVDTGMGLERLLKTIEMAETIFETSSFLPLLEVIDKESSFLETKIKRILADHSRAIVFLISDGVLPSNKEAGYVLRRLLRRLITYSKIYQFDFSLLLKLKKVVEENYGNFYPELFNKREEANSIIEEEYQKFQRALKQGLRELERIPEIDAKKAFYLYETFGLPFEVIKEIGAKKIKNLSYQDFEKEFKKHQEVSRRGAVIKFGGHGISDKMKKEEIEKITKLHTATHLLQAALRKILGPEVKQAGSDINPQRLRFDFFFSKEINQEELNKVESLVNEKISQDLEVKKEEMSLSEAMKSGALAFFKAKYPPRVSVYSIFEPKSGEVFSKEICAGPHVKSTKVLGNFQIIKLESIGSGLKRIKATLQE